jgi:hypothetical protein
LNKNFINAHLNKESDGLKITTFNNIDYLEFYLSSSKNIIFKLELYDDYLGPKKLIFDKLYFKDNFIDSLKKYSKENSWYYSYLGDFFKKLIEFNK